MEDLLDRHPNVLSYTPRKIIAWWNLAQRRRRSRAQQAFVLARLAAHGGKKDVDTLTRALED